MMASPQFISADPEPYRNLTNSEPTSATPVSEYRWDALPLTGGIEVAPAVLQPLTEGENPLPIVRHRVVRALGAEHAVALDSDELYVVSLSADEGAAPLATLRLPAVAADLAVVRNQALVVVSDYHTYGARAGEAGAPGERWVLLLQVDLSDPGAPRVVGQIPLPGRLAGVQVGQAAGVEGVYVALREEVVEPPSGFSWRTTLYGFELGQGGPEERSKWVAPELAQNLRLDDGRLVLISQGMDLSQRVRVFELQESVQAALLGEPLDLGGRAVEGHWVDLMGTLLTAVSTNGQATFIDRYDLSRADTDGFHLRCELAPGRRARGAVFAADHVFLQTAADEYTPVVEELTVDLRGATACESVAGEVQGAREGTLAQTLFGGTRLLQVYPEAGKATVVLKDVSAPTEEPKALATVAIDHPLYLMPAAASVQEDAVSVLSRDGIDERGLLLLPVAGDALAAVTFSAESLTLRGLIADRRGIQRAIPLPAGRAMLLERYALSRVELSDTGTPRLVGRAPLKQPAYQVFRLGGHLVALRPNLDGNSTGSRLDVLAKGQAPAGATVVASVDLPQGASGVMQVGDLLLAHASGGGADVAHEFAVFDFSDVTQPREAGAFTVEGGPASLFVPSEASPPYALASGATFAADGALAIAVARPYFEDLGRVDYCRREPDCTKDPAAGQVACGEDDGITGSQDCYRLFGDDLLCRGTFLRCPESTPCEPYDEPVPTTDFCSERTAYREWSSYEFLVVDLTDPDAPAVAAERPALPAAMEGTAVVPGQGVLHVAAGLSVDLPEDSLSYYAHTVFTLDLGNPSEPRLDGGRGIPGRLFAVDGDRRYSLDWSWEADEASAAIKATDVEEDEVIAVDDAEVGRAAVKEAVRLPSGALLLGLDKGVETTYALWDWESLEQVSELAVADPVAGLQFVAGDRFGVEVAGGQLLINAAEDTLREQAYFNTGLSFGYYGFPARSDGVHLSRDVGVVDGDAYQYPDPSLRFDLTLEGNQYGLP